MGNIETESGTTFEVLQSEATQEQYNEWNQFKDSNECAVCGGELQIRTFPARKSIGLACPTDAHYGFRKKMSLTTAFRQGHPISVAIEDKIVAKMFSGDQLQQAMNLLSLRYPDAIKDPPGAALFIRDCMRLGLDPLIQPAEAVPISFKVKGTQKYSVSMIITEDGYLSMAARGCPDEWDGAPATMPLLHYLMREYPERSLDELKMIVTETAAELCGDAKAYVWVALGKRRSSETVNPVYGWFTQADLQRAKNGHLPSGELPGNQARIRAVKRWARETFPESRSKMVEYYNMLEAKLEQTDDDEIGQIIDAEYHLISDSMPNIIENQPSTKGTAKTREVKPETGKAGAEVDSRPAAPVAEPGSGVEEPSESSEAPSSQTELFNEPKGFIDIPAIRDLMSDAKWSEATAISWLSGRHRKQYKGKLADILPTLTKEQADEFVEELESRQKSK